MKSETDEERRARWERDRYKGPEESREEMLVRWEREGRLDPACAACQEFYASPRRPSEVHAPRHAARQGCRPHCTCDGCW